MKSISQKEKINRKTGKKQYVENFHIDEHGVTQRGKLPPLIIPYMKELNGEIIEVIHIPSCKFCFNALPKLDEKGHDRIFCSPECNRLYWKIRKIIEEKREQESDIEIIIWNPIKIKLEEWTKTLGLIPAQYKIPERIDMKIIRKNKPDKENWEVLTTKRRKPKTNV